MELLHVADATAREKGLEREEVLQALEVAFQKAGRTKYGQQHDIRAEINRQTGNAVLRRFREVVAEITDPELESSQITLADAARLQPTAEIGEFIVEELPPIEFGRVAVQTVKQVLVQQVRDAERRHQFDEFKDRVGEIVSVQVKRVEYGNATCDMGGKGEGILRRDETLPREHLKNGERIRAYIYDVRAETRGPQIFLSRTHPQFMAKLFEQEVPEIYDGVIQIKAVARDPGSRAKIGVVSNDSSIDPVGACVGMRGSRVQAVVNELGGEKVDIIPWSPDQATFVVNALAPAEVTKVVLDEATKRIEVVVPDDQLSLAIGRRGQNVRLASMLTGYDIDILTEAEESERRQKETAERTGLFTAALEVDDVIAHLLVAEGFTNLEEIAYIELEELASIEGFDVDIASELQSRALNWLQAEAAAQEQALTDLAVSDELRAIAELTTPMLIALAKNDVKTLDDLADLAGDELVEYLGSNAMSLDQANEIIMAARAHWFDDDKATA